MYRSHLTSATDFGVHDMNQLILSPLHFCEMEIFFNPRFLFRRIIVNGKELRHCNVASNIGKLLMCMKGS